MQLGSDGRFDGREKERMNGVVGGVMMSKWWQMRLLVDSRVANKPRGNERRAEKPPSLVGNQTTTLHWARHFVLIGHRSSSQPFHCAHFTEKTQKLVFLDLIHSFSHLSLSIPTALFVFLRRSQITHSRGCTRFVCLEHSKPIILTH